MVMKSSLAQVLAICLAGVAGVAAGGVFDVPIGAIHVAHIRAGDSAVFKFALTAPQVCAAVCARGPDVLLSGGAVRCLCVCVCCSWALCL